MDELDEAAHGTFDAKVALFPRAFFRPYLESSWDPIDTLLKGRNIPSYPKDDEWTER